MAIARGQVRATEKAHVAVLAKQTHPRGPDRATGKVLDAARAKEMRQRKAVRATATPHLVALHVRGIRLPDRARRIRPELDPTLHQL